MTTVDRTARRTMSAVAAALLAAGTAVLPPSGQAHAAPQPLAWGACPAVHGASPETRCATVRVPRDYARPDGATITVTVSLLPARDQAGKRGVLVGNPGGPGGDGIGMFTANAPTAELRDDWDLVAVQPRGLLGSTPVRCDPITEVAVANTAGLGALNRDRCEKNTPGYTKTLTTETTARDIEQVRKALGVDRISLYGVSYGTWLMATYATLFPRHTDRVVLDSAMDPARAWGALLQEQTAGYRARAHQMMAWIAAEDHVYHLGTTPLAVYQRWSAVVEREAGVTPSLAAPPARIGDVPPGLTAIAGAYLAGTDLTADVRARFENLLTTLGNPGRIQASSPLLRLTRGVAPDRNGWPLVAQRIAGMTEPRPLTPDAQAAVANFGDMQPVILCNEDWSPKNPGLAPGAVIQNALLGDVFELPGLLYGSGLGCGGTSPVTSPVPLTAERLSVRPLQIQSVGDPQTPYRASMAMRRAMGAHLITVGGGDHGQFGRSNRPLDAAIAEYLRTGRTAVTRVPQAPITAPLRG